MGDAITNHPSELPPESDDMTVFRAAKLDVSQLELDAIFEEQTQKKFDCVPDFIRPQGLQYSTR